MSPVGRALARDEHLKPAAARGALDLEGALGCNPWRRADEPHVNDVALDVDVLDVVTGAAEPIDRTADASLEGLPSSSLFSHGSIVAKKPAGVCRRACARFARVAAMLQRGPAVAGKVADERGATGDPDSLPTKSLEGADRSWRRSPFFRDLCHCSDRRF